MVCCELPDNTTQHRMCKWATNPSYRLVDRYQMVNKKETNLYEWLLQLVLCIYSGGTVAK